MNKVKLFNVTNIRVGFNNRSDTYSGKLGFLSYFDNGKSLINETPFYRWIDKRIPLFDFENDFQGGFVLAKANIHQLYNKSIGFVRVYHPNGFDFEIPLDNFFYLMQFTLIDHGEIKGKCKVFFGENGKPWLLNEEAFKSDFFQFLKKDGVKKGSSVNKLNVNQVVVDKNNRKYLAVETNKVIYPFTKNFSMFYADEYAFNNNPSYKLKIALIPLDKPNDYKSIIFKKGSDLIEAENMSIEEKAWSDKLKKNKCWNFIEWNNSVNDIIDYDDKAIPMMLKHVYYSFKSSEKEINNFDDFQHNIKNELKKLSLSKILISNFVLSFNNVNYRLLIAQNNRIESMIKTNKILPNKYFYIYLIHLGENELLKRNKVENEAFENVKLIPIASIDKKDLDDQNFDISVKAIKSLIRKEGFNI